MSNDRTVDMSSEAVNARLEDVRGLYRLAMSLVQARVVRRVVMETVTEAQPSDASRAGGDDAS